jgi:hypothetical protein
MLATLEATRQAYDKFLSKYRAGSNNFFNPELAEPTDHQLALRRVWVAKVFQPTNKRVYELIVNIFL